MSIPSKIVHATQCTRRQMIMTFDAAELCGMSVAQRTQVLAHLTNLLMLAANSAAKGCDDDEH